MQTASIDVYVGAAVARWDVTRRPGQPVVDEPGVRGLLPCADDPLVRLLVTDDRAYDVLTALLPGAEAGIINVFAAAARCAELVGGHSAWRPESGTAMICRDLRNVPAVSLPSELTVRRLACGVFGREATVIFVNTHPDWRGRGIGQAMTAAALRAAKDRGARRACLNATAAGLSIYLRLGFEPVARTTHFFRATG